ncbi:hypothetical protein [Janthinobacterium sp. LB2P70]|uniref:hypothetical protein n=1 Tax=Janthinobacterium sp. LB2P70 TaxID=3424197 RepID=UPI003F21F756
MLINTLVAGLFGAIVAGMINFFVRRFLDKKAIHLAERKLAYVHFVRISGMLATEMALKNIFKLYAKDVKIGSEERSGYSISHDISVLISAKLNEIDSKEIAKNPNIKMAVNFVEFQVEDLKGNKLSFDDLSKFPKEIINDYSNFLSVLSHIIVSLDFWKVSMSTGEFKWATPESIYDQWLLLQRFSKSVASVRSKMLGAGVVTPLEAHVLLKSQLDFLNNITLQSLLNRDALKAAGNSADMRKSKMDNG